MKTLLKVTVAMNAACLVVLAAFALAWHIDFTSALAQRLFSASIAPGILALLAFVPTMIALLVALVRGVRAKEDAGYYGLVFAGFAVEAALFPLIMFWIVNHQV